MRLRFVRPWPALRPYIESFWVFESDSGFPATDTSIAAPNGCAKLIIPYRNSLLARHPVSRHSCHATYLARQGAPVTVTQSQLGHRNSSTTLQYYVHPMPDLQDEHVGRLAARLMGRRDDTTGGSGSTR